MSLNDGTPQVSHTQNDLLLVTETTADAGISRHLTILDDYHHPTMLGDVYFALNQRYIIWRRLLPGVYSQIIKKMLF